jgi:hypothetical protein
VHLVDYDRVVDANWTTGLLTSVDDVDSLKTRVVAHRLEALGHGTALVERRFDSRLQPQADEPVLALAGFDDPAPRRVLDDRFQHAIDIGLGKTHTEFMDMLIHSFPSQLCAESAFEARAARSRPLGAAYRTEFDRLVAAGVAPGQAQCGMLSLAGVTVAAAFIGATAGALGVGGLLRTLHGGTDYAVIGLDMRTPEYIRVVPNTCPSADLNPGFTEVREY